MKIAKKKVSLNLGEGSAFALWLSANEKALAEFCSRDGCKRKYGISGHSVNSFFGVVGSSCCACAVLCCVALVEFNDICLWGCLLLLVSVSHHIVEELIVWIFAIYYLKIMRLELN